MSSEHYQSNQDHASYYAVDGEVLHTIYSINCSSTVYKEALWMVIDLENTFDVEYVSLYNLIETLGKELYLSKVEPCYMYFDNTLIHNGTLVIFTLLLQTISFV